MPTPSALLAGIRNRATLLARSGLRFARYGDVRPPFPVRVGRRWVSVEAPDQQSQGVAYLEVHVFDGYGLRDLRDPRLIVDVGANVGIFSLAARARFPSARIVAVEPNPAAIPYLQRNCAPHGIEVVPKALGSRAGTIRFYADEDLVNASAVAADPGSPVVEVEQIRWESLGLEQEIDLLKLDCEGAEWEILFDSDILRATRRLAMEYHLVPGRRLAELKGLLADHSFEIVGMSEEPGVSYGMLRAVRREPRRAAGRAE